MSDDQKTCPKCAESVRAEATACRFCGYQFSALARLDKSMGCGFALLIFLGLAYCGTQGQKPGALDSSPVTSTNDDSSVSRAWEYSSDTDNITNGTINYAALSSPDKATFDFPYQGGATLTLYLRKHPRWGTSAFFQIDKGQFHCQIGGCTVSASFDGKRRSLSLTEPDDASSETLFIEAPQSFIKRLRRAHTVTVELPFFQEGNRQFAFRPAGLVWPPPK